MSELAVNGGKPIRNTFLPFSQPFIGNKEIEEVVSTLRSGWITTGPKAQEFERKFSEYVDSKYAVAVNSCTAALHLALEALGIDKNDEVITTTFTFASTVNVIIYQNAKPVLVDIKEDTYNIDPDKISEAITSKTKAIIPVHYGGQPCDMDLILKIAKENNVAVIEDAAHAVGSEFKGKKIGSISDITCFSFYPTKNITTIEGGMITTNSKELAEKTRILSLHGMSRDAWKRYSSNGSWFYEIEYPGYKYNMTDIQASLGLVQLERIDDFYRIREKQAEIYLKAFKNTPEIITPKISKNVKHTWHLFPIQLNLDLLKIDRARFIEALKAENIGSSVHFIPVHLHPFYAKTFGFKKGDFPVAEKVYNRIVSLPIYPKMTAKDVNDVILAVRKILDNSRK
jgi:dTDP-4-amino-4,6-dideoxygalactose transaminase